MKMTFLEYLKYHPIDYEDNSITKYNLSSL
jgi:hypothetical protein